MSEKNPLFKLLNASGFPFQLAIEHLVEKKKTGLDFEIVGREHPWHHEKSGGTGFIDLVITKGRVRIVIECKRTIDADWLFLIPDNKELDSPVFNCHWTLELDEEHILAKWDKVHMQPRSPASQFCNIRGGGENKISMLDRIGAELVHSTEALALDEMKMERNGWMDAPTVFVPTIVTNAQLSVAKFDPSRFDLVTGKIDEAEFQSVGFLRYAKALDPIVGCLSNKVSSIKEMNKESQRSIFVVNADSLLDFLSELAFPRDDWAKYPWEIAQQQFQRKKKDP